MEIEEKEKQKTLQFISFVLENKIYAIPISYVREINKLYDITIIPNSEYFIEGITNLRGEIIPVVNVRKRFGLSDESPVNRKKRKLIIIDYQGSPVGLLVDGIAEVVKIVAEDIESESSEFKEIGMEFVSALGKTDKGIIPILNINKVINK